MNSPGNIFISPLLTDRPTRSEQGPIEARLFALLILNGFISFHARCLSTRGQPIYLRRKTLRRGEVIRDNKIKNCLVDETKS